MPTLALILSIGTAIAALPLMGHLDRRETRLRRIKARLARSTNIRH